MNLKEHLMKRGLDPDKYDVVIGDGIATFLLWNLSGQLCGYQQYNPLGDKTLHGITFDRKDLAKYYTYVGHEGDPTHLGGQKRAEHRIAIWGLESLDLAPGYVFITEGIFDAVKVHNAGHPCLGVLMNDPQKLRPFFKALGRDVFPIVDRDDAGGLLKKFGRLHVLPPEPYKDLGDTPQAEVDHLIRGFLQNVQEGLQAF